MSIRYAILGLLSWQPCSGYDLKKIISDSTAFFWSGNNNQVYTTLVQLHKKRLVEYTVQAQESLPAKKIYSITAAGRGALRQWVLSTLELPELHNTFLIQLSWADQLSPGELDDLLARYEEEVRMQLLMQQEKNRRATSPDRSPREAFLWQKIADNITGSFENELAWIRDLRQGLEKFT
jgi:PadR family transcriptional regulator AphA